jgi:threonine/homoserine/homoserine lactone efflux protein
MGISFADTIFSLIALFGLSAIKVDVNNIWLRIFAGLTFSIVGFFMYKNSTVAHARKPVTGKSYFKYFISAFLLTLTNPLTILFFAASFAALGYTGNNMTLIKYFLVIGGVVLGTITWWTFITAFISMFRKKIRLRMLLWINKITGIIVLILGLLMILSIFIDGIWRY